MEDGIISLKKMNEKINKTNNLVWLINGFTTGIIVLILSVII